jgi:Uncharacterized protein conserved in bacteria
MSLNIKNEHVHELVREASKRTGKSQTSVVEEALRHYLDELDRDTREQRVDEILAAIDARRAQNPDLYNFDVDSLYDASGLPA